MAPRPSSPDAHLSAPRLVVVWPLEDAPYAYVLAWSFEDEQRLRLDLHGRRRLAVELVDALAVLLDALDDRADEFPEAA